MWLITTTYWRIIRPFVDIVGHVGTIAGLGTIIWALIWPGTTTQNLANLADEVSILLRSVENDANAAAQNSAKAVQMLQNNQVQSLLYMSASGSTRAYKTCADESFHGIEYELVNQSPDADIKLKLINDAGDVLWEYEGVIDHKPLRKHLQSRSNLSRTCMAVSLDVGEVVVREDFYVSSINEWFYYEEWKNGEIACDPSKTDAQYRKEYYLDSRRTFVPSYDDC